MYHILVSDGITFLCMAEESFGRRIPYAFLEDISQRFFSSYGSTCREVRGICSGARGGVGMLDGSAGRMNLSHACPSMGHRPLQRIASTVGMDTQATRAWPIE